MKFPFPLPFIAIMRDVKFISIAGAIVYIYYEVCVINKIIVKHGINHMAISLESPEFAL